MTEKLRHYKLTLSFLFCSLLYFVPVKAQIVNMEDRRIYVPDSIRILGFADISGNFFKNDQSLLSLKGLLQVEYRKENHLVISVTNYNLVKTDDSNLLNDGYQHLRYNNVLGKWLTWEAFGQIQYNERIRLQVRGLVGTGPRIRFKPVFNQRIHLGVLPMYEYNQIRDTAIIHRDFRLSTYLSLHIQSNDKKLKITSTTYFQPLFSDFGNFRVASETSIVFQLLRSLSWKTSASYYFDNDIRIPDSIVNEVFSVTNGLRLDF